MFSICILEGLGRHFSLILVPKAPKREVFWSHFGDFWGMYWTCENWALARVPARSRGLGGFQKSSIFDVFSGIDSRRVFWRCFFDFLRFWEPQGSPWCSKMAPKCHGKTSNSGPNSGKWSRGGPRVPLGVILDAIWSYFRCILDEFWWGKPWKSAALC